MRQSNLLVFPCPYDRPCANYQCRGLTKGKMWFIGVKESLANCTIFCEDCIKHMIANLPDELVPADEAVLENIKAAVLKEVETDIAEKNAQILQLTEEVARLSVIEPQNEETVVVEPPGTAEPADVESLGKSDVEQIGQENEVVVNDPSVQVDQSAPVVTEPNIANSDVFRCLDCGKDFKSEVALKTHIGKMHKE